jgi:hypothetical protein
MMRVKLEPDPHGHNVFSLDDDAPHCHCQNVTVPKDETTAQQQHQRLVHASCCKVTHQSEGTIASKVACRTLLRSVTYNNSEPLNSTGSMALVQV